MKYRFIKANRLFEQDKKVKVKQRNRKKSLNYKKIFERLGVLLDSLSNETEILIHSY